ncbi:MAG: SbcC/MukB-like Walker B domain-containing protein, partial [Vagococcus sp.]
REPEQLVKKQRGEGFREQPSNVRLTIYDEMGQEINQMTKQKDVGPFLSDLLQLNEQQFSQIVMLPQGEFRRFLIADSNSKEKVLRKLFNTYFYQDVAEYLKDQKKHQEKTLDGIQQELRVLVNQLEWPADIKENNDIKEMHYKDVLDLYKEASSLFYQREKELESSLKEAKLKEKEHQGLLQEEKKWQEKFEEYRDVLKQLESLNEEGLRNQEIKEKLDCLIIVKENVSVFHRLIELTEEKETVQKELAEAKEQEKQLKESLALTSNSLGLILKEETEVLVKKETLKEMEKSIPLVEKKKMLEEQVRQIEKELVETNQQQMSLEETVSKLKKQQNELTNLLKSKPALLENKYLEEKQLVEKKQQEKQLKEYQLMQQQLLVKESLLLEKEEQLSKSTTEWEAADKHYKEMKSEWAKAQIAKLSLDLVPGEACPVCGATEHPKTTHGELLTKEDMKILEEKLEKAEIKSIEKKETLVTIMNQKDYAKKELVSLKDELHLKNKELRNYLQIDIPEDEWLSQVIVEKEKLEESIQQKADRLSEMLEQEEALEVQGVELVSSEGELTIVAEKKKALETRLLINKTTLTDLLGDLSTEWGNLKELVDKQKVLQEEVAQWLSLKEKLSIEKEEQAKALLISQTTLKTSKEKAREINKKWEAKQEEWDYFLNQEKLTEEEGRLLINDLPKLEVYRSQLVEFSKKEYALNESRETLENQLGDRQEPNLAPLIELAHRLKEKVDILQQQWTELTILLKNNQKLIDTVMDKESSKEDMLRSFEEIAQLADVMSGDGPHKLSVERFVLQTYLKKILERGNEKLIVLTNGRYRFELKEEQGAFKNKTGLEINIFDDNVGAIRSVNTLSGGESFIAALSLSLSLSEVIQEESGGIKIDAMFIDEGFGSLDEDALELAIRSLESIEGAGRLIGIISHVRELKERIPQQLQVKSTVDGKSYVETWIDFEKIPMSSLVE